jgi:hypothetical protein
MLPALQQALGAVSPEEWVMPYPPDPTYVSLLRQIADAAMRKADYYETLLLAQAA